jgi:hypothetical protein
VSASWSLPIHCGGSDSLRFRNTYSAANSSRASTPQSIAFDAPLSCEDPADDFRPFAAKYASVTMAVIESAAPPTYASEFRRQPTLVARNTELMI